LNIVIGAAPVDAVIDMWLKAKGNSRSIAVLLSCIFEVRENGTANTVTKINVARIKNGENMSAVRSSNAGKKLMSRFSARPNTKKLKTITITAILTPTIHDERNMPGDMSISA